MSEKTQIIRLNPDIFDSLPDQVARYAGGTEYHPAPGMINLAERMIKKVKEIATPAYGYSVIPVIKVISPDVLVLNSGFKVKSIKPLVSGIKFIIVLVYTIGAEFDNEAARLTHKAKNLKLLFFNASCLVMLDAVFNMAYTKIQKNLKKKGYYTGSCEEPGCESSSLENQHVLLDYIDVKALGISINQSFMMTPLKSIFCWLPAAETPLKTDTENKCMNCSLKTCVYRQHNVQRR